MRIVSSALFIPVLACATIVTAGQAQAPGDDSARSRAVRQSGNPVSAASDVVFRQAEQMVREGRGEAGRALVDSLLAKTRAGSPQYGQALYWRASLAADAAEAERGYRRVILEYPATPAAGDALINLAQLEMVRGDQEQALMHLHRFEREYPSHDSRARASLWLGRLYFDRKNERRACASLATARIAASPDDMELRNQIDYQTQRCIGVDTTSPPPRSTTAVAAVDANAPAGASPSPAAAAEPVAPPPTAGSASNAAVPAENHTRPAQPVMTTADSTSHIPISVGRYTVQVAAYDTRAAAEELIAKLKARGYTARLATTTRPFRVRIGRYGTRADAIAAQQRLKAKGIDAFVTEMEKP